VSNELRERGVAHLRGIVPEEMLAVLRKAAAACFQTIEAGRPIPEHCRFNRFSNSVVLPALLDFGCSGPEDLLAPVEAAGLDSSACRMEDSWVRKKGPAHIHAHTWHQDGALGVRFPPQPGAALPMTLLTTFWVPLDPCGVDAPGLEFVRRRLDGLLHFTELNDADLRRRFAPEEFWAPALDPGDGLVFLNGTLHRTYLPPKMRRPRVSLEYRLALRSA
jgi:hypothetical protein